MHVTTQKLSELWNLQHVLQGPDSLEMGGTAFGNAVGRILRHEVCNLTCLNLGLNPARLEINRENKALK